MSKQHKVNTAYNIVYATDGDQTGLIDLRVDYYDAAGTHDPLIDFVVLTEIGTTGNYTGSFTPATVGSWTLSVTSATSAPAITGKTGRLDVVAFTEDDTRGGTFNATTDSNEAIRNAVDGVSSSIAAISRGGLLI